ncbi:MAG TPA: hypothetical protein VGG84_14285 [Gemmatimonadaceae bacterium]|jgi:hypothetical protein
MSFRSARPVLVHWDGTPLFVDPTGYGPPRKCTAMAIVSARIFVMLGQQNHAHPLPIGLRRVMAEPHDRWRDSGLDVRK